MNEWTSNDISAMITLSNNTLRVDLCRPGEYYKGTRFDHAGIFRRIEMDGYVYADEWFDHQDPYRHDRVCGLSEEFVTVDFTGVAPGETFCKPGAGLLKRPDDAPYDWFRLYEIADPGEWDVQANDSEVTYRHILNGWYKYTKTIRLTSGNTLEIAHEMHWEADNPLSGYFYNHNFLTFGGKPVGPDRRIATAWPPKGNWRNDYDNVHFTDNGVEFLGPVDPACSVYCGDMHNPGGPTTCQFSIADGSNKVQVSGDMPIDHIVLWASPRVACMEPYMPINLRKGESAFWTFNYRFDSGMEKK